MSRPNYAVGIDEFRGLVTNADPHDLPAGAAQAQTNLQCLVPGKLTVRGGLVPVAYANATSATASNMISMFGTHRPGGEWVLYQLADGTLHAGRSPS